MPVEESATGVVKVVFSLTSKDNGKFLAVIPSVNCTDLKYDGTTHSW